MRVQTKSKSGLFLVELILAILFFSIASAVCIQIFVTAHLISEKSRNKSMAILAAESAAEVLKGTEGSAEKMAELLEASVTEGENESKLLTVLYDQNWSRLPVLSGRSPTYRMSIVLQNQTTETGVFAAGEIQLVKEEKPGDVIYHLSVRKYLRPSSQ